MEQEMSRKEFIKKLGIGVIAIIGIPAFLKILSSTPDTGVANKDVSNGYSNGPYGL